MTTSIKHTHYIYNKCIIYKNNSIAGNNSFKSISDSYYLLIMVHSLSSSLKSWTWISIPFVDVVVNFVSPFSFLIRVVFPASAQPITIPLPLYTGMVPFFMLLTNCCLLSVLQLTISGGTFTKL